MGQKDFFSADALSEHDRIAALSRIIHEFEALRAAEGSELFHKRRQMLLSLWGDLVLARKDPSVPVIEDSPPAEVKADEVLPSPSDKASAPQQDDQAHAASHQVEAHHDEPRESEDVAHKLEQIDPLAEFSSEEVMPSHDSDENNETQAHTSEHDVGEADRQEVVHDAELEPSQSMSESTELLDSTDADLVSENFEKVEHVDAQEIHDLPQEENNTSEPVIFTIAEGFEQSETIFGIDDIHDDHDHHESQDLSIAAPAESIDTALAKIFDIQPKDKKFLIEIENIEADTLPLNNIAHINSDKISDHVPSLVRMRLLKAGVLHDVVLPEGTVVSTNAADAEDLIASGTAERLLIQSDDKDDDDY